MDKGEIAVDYARAKNHKRQIQILAELNACSKEQITDILREKGYKMIFNTNGVDVSLKTEEIRTAYQNGMSNKELSKQYHVSAKGMKEILEIKEEAAMASEKNEEHIDKEQLAKMDSLHKEIAKLKHEKDKLTEENDCLHAECENLRHQLGDIHGKYQDVCIRNSQLGATVDTLIDKISLLKAVGCNGR